MRIPVYSRKTTPQVGQVAPRESVAEARMVGVEVARAGETLANTSLKFEKLRAIQQTNQAKISAYKGFSDINTRAQIDPDIDDPNVQQKYFEEMSSLRTTALANIQNSAARRDFETLFDLDAIRQQTQIGGYGRKMLISKDIATTYEGLNLMRETYIGSDKEARIDILSRAEKQINALAERGTITKEEAYTRKETLKNNWETKARAREADIEKALKTARDENQRTLTLEMINATTEEQKLGILERAKTLLGEQKLDVSVYDNIKKRMETPYAESLDLTTYIEIQNMIENEKPAQEIYDTILAKSDKLTEGVAKQLVSDVQTEQKLNIKEIIKNESYGVKAWGDQVIGGKFTEEAITGEAKGKIEELQYEFYRRVQQESPKTREEVSLIAQEVKNDYMREKYPELNNIQEIPDVVLDIKGQVNRLFNPKSKSNKAGYKIQKGKDTGYKITR